MKISFEDNSFVELKKENDSFILTIQAKDHENSRKKITNTVSLSKAELIKLLLEFKDIMALD